MRLHINRKAHVGVEGAGVVPWVVGPPDAYFGFFGIPKPDQYRKDIIQQVSLDTDML